MAFLGLVASQSSSHPAPPATIDRRAADENFHVFSRFLPTRLVADFRAVYAFCRTADDLADNPQHSPAERIAALNSFQHLLDATFAGQPPDEMFTALLRTATRHAIPIEPFRDLLAAFRQDQEMTRYDSWNALLDYCSRSANPVGRIVLALVGVRDVEAMQYSDDICTALQLVNFWQDVRRDHLELGRTYIPADVAAAHGLSLERLAASFDGDVELNDADAAAYRATMIDLCDRTRNLFDRGRRLHRMIPLTRRPLIRLFSLGGEAMLRQIQAADYRTDRSRPTLSRARKSMLLVRAFFPERRR